MLVAAHGNLIRAYLYARGSKKVNKLEDFLLTLMTYLIFTLHLESVKLEANNNYKLIMLIRCHINFKV